VLTNTNFFHLLGRTEGSFFDRLISQAINPEKPPKKNSQIIHQSVHFAIKTPKPTPAKKIIVAPNTNSIN